jgi:hypothetical protein
MAHARQADGRAGGLIDPDGPSSESQLKEWSQANRTDWFEQYL